MIEALLVNKRLILIVIAFFHGCGSGDASEDTRFPRGGDRGAYSEDEGQFFDEDAARERAEEEVRSDGYSGPCTQDCSGHDAGFEWAADGNPDYGVSRSPSFDEGQQAYEQAVEERVEDYRSAYENGEQTNF
jgi:hypothetical protein